MNISSSMVQMPVVATPTMPTPAGPNAGLPAAPAALPTLPANVRTELLGLARAYPEQRWNASAGWAAARNAHVTNTIDQLRDSLRGPYNYLEGDIRTVDGVPVMRHGTHDNVDMQLAEWLEIGRESGRGLKMDIKEQGAIIPSVLLAKRAGIDASHLLVNISAKTDPIILMAVRQIYPTATVNISPDGALDQAGLDQLMKAATVVKGAVMFPLRVDLITQNIVDQLKPHGAIAIWNDPSVPGVSDIPALTKQLRAMGVDGMIDLRPSERAA